MKALYSLRTLLLALAVSVMPAMSFGGVFISVNFAPPVLPVYEQPPCPEPGLIWIPGYWAYDEDGYYWVPGTWVPAPFEGALWTPPYWGWDGGLYVFHPGYWGTHVGYYGGVNYGFGYMGVGFVGGRWRGHDFIYNTAVMRVDERRVRNVYVDRDVVRRYTIVNDRHVAFSGGRDGIHHDPLPEERFADRDRHVTETSYQQSHENAARSDRSYYARNNGGHPNNVVVQRPMNSGPNTFGDSNRGPFGNRDNNQRDQYRGNPQQDNPQYRGGYGDPRSNQRGADNRNTYNPPPNANGGQDYQNRDNNGRGQYRGNPQQEQSVPQQNNPHDRGFGDPRSNERGHDNRNTYNPPPNAGYQGQDNGRGNNPGQDQYRNQNPQPGNQAPQYRNAPPQQQQQQQPQWRQYNNGHGGQDNMQNRGGPPPQQQPQPQPQPQQPRGDQGGGGNHGGDRGGDHGRGHDR